MGLRLALVLALLLFGFLQALRSGTFAEPARRAVGQIGSQLLGADLYVERIDVTQVLPPQLRVRGLTLHAAQGPFAGLPLVRVDALDVDLASLPDLRRRVVAISAVRLVRPAARVALVEGRLRDFGDLIDRLKPAEPPKNPVQVQLADLRVEGASTRVSVLPKAAEGAADRLREPLGLRVAGLDLALTQDAQGDGEGQLSAELLELVVGEFREQGRLEQGGFTIDAGVVEIDHRSLYLTTGRVDVEGFVRLPSPPGQGSARPLAYSIEARADLDLDRLQHAWPKLPPILGELGAALTITGEGADPKIAFAIEGEDVAVQAWAKRKQKWQTFHAGTFTLLGRFEGSGVLLDPGSVVQYGGGTVHVTGSLGLGGQLPYSVEAHLRGVSLERILAAVTIPGSFCAFNADGEAWIDGTLKGGIRGAGHASVDVQDLVVTAGPWNSPSVPRRMLHVPVAHVESDISLSRRSLLLAPSVVSGPNSRLDVSTEFLFGAPLGLDIRVSAGELDLDDLSNEVAGQPLQGHGIVEQVSIAGLANDLEIKGSLELDDFVLRGWPFGRVDGDAHWRARGDLEFLGLRGSRGETDFDAEVRVLFANTRHGGTREGVELAVEAVVPEGHGRAEDLLPIFFGDSINATGKAWGRALLSGPPSALQGRGEIHGADLRYLWEDFESLDLLAEVVDGNLVVEEAFVRKSADEVLFARGTIGRERLDVEFRLPGMQLRSIRPIRDGLSGDGEAPLTGLVSGSAVLGGTLRDLSLRGRVGVHQLTWRGEPLGDGDVRVGIANGQLRAEGSLLDRRMDLLAEAELRGLFPYRFGVDLRPFDLGPFMPLRFLGRSDPVRAGVAGVLKGHGTLRDSWHELALALDELWLERGTHRIEAPEGEGLKLSLSGGALRFDQVNLVSPDQRTDLRVEGWLRPDGPLELSIDGPVDISFADLVVDAFDRSEADLLNLHLDISGMSAKAVDIEGGIRLRGALLRTIWFPHALEVTEASVSLRDRRVTLDSFVGRLAGGRIEDAAGSTIRLDRSGYKPRQYDLHLDCVDCTVRYPSFLPPASGRFELTFRGTAPDRLTLGGRVHVTEMVMREPLNWQRSAVRIGERATQNLATDEGEGLFNLDLRFSSDPEAVRMVNNVGDLRGTALDFRVAGDTRHLLLLGDIGVDGGTLPFNGRSFELEPGTATFAEGTSWFPDLDLRMSTEITNRDQNYRITYVITGPLNGPTLSAFSEPALSQADINSLLLFDLTQDQLAEANLTQLAAAASSTAIGTLVENAATSLGQSVDSSALPDRFEIVPIYTDATGATTVWAVATKEVVPDLLTLEGGLGLGGTRAAVLSSVARARLRFARNVFLEGSWVRDDRATQDYGNFGLDLKLRFEVR